MTADSLLTRLQEAPEGSRGLDWEIARIVYPSLGSEESALDEVFLPDGPPLPAFSTSLDSALSLVTGDVEKAWSLERCNGSAWFGPWAAKPDDGSFGQTPALAICVFVFAEIVRQAVEG